MGQGPIGGLKVRHDVRSEWTEFNNRYKQPSLDVKLLAPLEFREGDLNQRNW